MKTFLNLLIAFIALEHLAFLMLEMFFWTKPLGLKIFRQKQEIAESSAILAKNQGLYNGFLAAGLIWSLLATDAGQASTLKIFCLGCVAIAGIYGGLTASMGIFFVQALPAIVALVLIKTIHFL